MGSGSPYGWPPQITSSDDFGKAVVLDPGPDIAGILVGARQLRNIGDAGEEAGVEARCLPLHDRRDVVVAQTARIGAKLLAETLDMCRAREVAATTMR